MSALRPEWFLGCMKGFGQWQRSPGSGLGEFGWWRFAVVLGGRLLGAQVLVARVPVRVGGGVAATLNRPGFSRGSVVPAAVAAGG
jgi:hypothetical protein